MKSRANGLILVFLLLGLVLSQNIVDFTFTEIDQRQGKVQKQKESITIRPNREIIQGYSFPEACYLARKLEDDKVDDSRELANYDLDSMIDKLKVDFVDLLKVSQKIKKKKANIEELSQISGRSYNVTVVPPKDLDLLKKQQQRLKEINSEITSKTEELEDLVKDSMRNSGGNEFAISSVNFEIQSLKLKLDYLRGLKRNSNDAQLAKVKDQYNKYFSDLKVKFDDQNGLFDDLNTILRNFNQIGELRAKILSIKGKIEVANLLIQEKDACAKEKDQIKKFQKNDIEIKTHMSNLREKKKDRSNIHNKYCEGVAKKLEDRIKKVLQSYDYTFLCAEGLEDIRRQRDEDRIQLQKAQDRLKYLESSAGIDAYKKKFDENRQFIKIKQEQLSRFSIPQYSHDINEINRLIEKAEIDLEDANRRKKDLGNPSDNKEVDYRRIQDLVASIKKLKGTYCHEYEKYDIKAQQLWTKVQRYEAQVEYSSKIRGVYSQEINQLRDLENLFDSLRSKILKSIQ